MTKNNLGIALVFGIAFAVVLAGMLGFFSTSTGKGIRFADNGTKCSGNTATGSTCGISVQSSYPILEGANSTCNGATCGISVQSSYPIL